MLTELTLKLQISWAIVTALFDTKDGLYLAYNSSDWNLTHSMTPSPPGDLVSIHDLDADQGALGGAVGLIHLVNLVREFLSRP